MLKGDIIDLPNVTPPENEIKTWHTVILGIKLQSRLCSYVPI
jgi:hypothetical protein